MKDTSHLVQSPKNQTIAYAVIALMIAMLMIDQYRHGQYSIVLANALLLPTLIFGAAYVYINRDRYSSSKVPYVLLLIIAMVSLSCLHEHSTSVDYFFYAIPFFSYLMLPMRHATWFNIGLMLAMIVTFSLPLTAWDVFNLQAHHNAITREEDASEAIRVVMAQFMFFMSALVYGYLAELRGAALQRLALTDQVSGASNHKHFYQLLERELARGQLTRQRVSLMGLYLNDYQQLIDLHGQGAMRRFLPDFVKSMRGLIRGEDDIFRVDEDLLVLVLPNCGEEGAMVLSERFKRRITEQNWSPFVELAVSVVVVTDQANDDAEGLEKRLIKRLQKQRRTSLQLAAFTQ
ncbi:MAG: diguanylate cyclase [Oleibacter sp.]|nr:diguanylate cyclase [Thalassolituus sp.]